jgi:alpha-L-rhamnosidase
LVIASDETWRAKAGPITYNDFCHGETFDARAASLAWSTAHHDASQWAHAELAPAPDGVLRAQIMPPVEVMQALPARSSTYPSDGIEVVDFGQHIAGWSRISVSGPAGATIVLRHAGAINDRGELNNENNMPPYSNARQTDTYILRGDSEETFEPSFTLHGFRYVEITQANGPVRINKIEARVAHSAVPQSGVFECDNALLNQIHRNVHWTLRASLQGGPQDAAERFERLFWLGDPGWMMDEYLYNFDAAAFWLKWLDDIQDCELPDGNLPFVAPLHWRGPCPGIYKFMEDLPYATWPDFSTTTFPVIVMKLYEFYGDSSIVERHYQTMANAHRFVEGVAVEDRLECGFGEHMEPQPDGTCVTQTDKTPMPLVSTSWYFHITQLLERAAKIVGRDADARRYGELASRIQAAFAKAFIDEKTGDISAETQSTLVIPLWHGVIPERYRARIAQALVADIERKGALNTGTMGTAALKHVLRDCGRSDLMFRLATSTSYPSWGNQVVRGATTIWESWGGDGERSLNMKLLASIDAFFYRDVAGLSWAAPGWRRLRVRPAVTHLLSHAQASVATPRGSARLDWRRENGRLTLAVEVPTTSEAEIYLPVESGESVRAGDVSIWDGHRPTQAGDTLGPMSLENGYLRFGVGGGHHIFTVETSF